MSHSQHNVPMNAAPRGAKHPKHRNRHYACHLPYGYAMSEGEKYEENCESSGFSRPRHILGTSTHSVGGSTSKGTKLAPTGSGFRERRASRAGGS